MINFNDSRWVSRMPFLITSEVAGLSRLQESQLDERILGWFSEEHLVRFYSRNPARFTRENLLADVENGWNTASLLTLAVHNVQTRQIVGVLRLGPMDWRHGLGDMPLIMGERQESIPGFATEVVKLGNQLAFEVCGLRKLHGGVYEANKRAVIAYGRAGWVSPGVLEDHYWVEECGMDRILVACYNPRFFPNQHLPSGVELYSRSAILGDLSELSETLERNPECAYWTQRVRRHSPDFT